MKGNVHFRLNVILPEEDPAAESRLVRAVEEAGAQWLSADVLELTGDNFGRCSYCGAWTSDRGKPDAIDCFSPGIRIGAQCFCDLCLPEEHPAAF